MLRRLPVEIAAEIILRMDVLPGHYMSYKLMCRTLNNILTWDKYYSYAGGRARILEKCVEDCELCIISIEFDSVKVYDRTGNCITIPTESENKYLCEILVALRQIYYKWRGKKLIISITKDHIKRNVYYVNRYGNVSKIPQIKLKHEEDEHVKIPQHFMNGLMARYSWKKDHEFNYFYNIFQYYAVIEVENLEEYTRIMYKGKIFHRPKEYYVNFTCYETIIGDIIMLIDVKKSNLYREFEPCDTYEWFEIEKVFDTGIITYFYESVRKK